MCGPGRNMVCSPNKSNRTFPQIWGSQLWCRNWDSHWNEIWKAVETNPIERFPKFEAHSEAPSSFEEVSWHFVKKKNTQKPIQKWIQMHGRANQSRNTTFKHFWRSWGLLKIPHQGGRGCGSRLSIWWWLELYLFDHPNRETAMLSTDKQKELEGTTDYWLARAQSRILCKPYKSNKNWRWIQNPKLKNINFYEGELEPDRLSPPLNKRHFPCLRLPHPWVPRQVMTVMMMAMMGGQT